MYCVYASELKVKSELDKLGVECFLPMKYDFVEHDGERRRQLVPAIHNLIFVHESIETITSLKMFNAVCVNLQYMMTETTDGIRQFLIVPDRQMDNFMRVASEMSDDVVYLRYDDFLNKEGRKVRIIDGNFNGVEGVIKRIKKNRIVVVMLKNIAAVAIMGIPPEHLQFCDD